MVTIVGVQFQKNGKIFNYDTGNLDIRQGDFVVADTPHGMDLGQAVVGCRQIEDTDSAPSLKRILRIATEKDLQTSAENREKEREAFGVCQRKIAEHKLDMKLVSVEYAFDNSKALFYFTANGRVDFRSLVKDLASVFKMRIELRQIGVRDEARMIGGLGPCGRQICCGSFLEEFQPVSIKMAKEQNLSLNPTKISGVCGRLMCCLKYEQDHYEQTRKIMPRIGREVSTPDGSGVVCDLNIVKETVFVRIANGDSSEIKEYPLDKIVKGAPNAPVQADEKPETPGPAADSIPVPEVETAVTPRDNARERSEKDPIKQNRNSKPRKNNPSTKNKENRKTDRNENAGQNQGLGKPVLRENPNRNSAVKSNSRQPAPAKAEESVSSAAAGKKDKPANWAEAVQKAMESIN